MRVEKVQSDTFEAQALEAILETIINHGRINDLRVAVRESDFSVDEDRMERWLMARRATRQERREQVVRERALAKLTAVERQVLGW